MRGTPTKAFEAVNRYLGWGEPAGGVWFVGMEESQGWNGSTEEQVIRHYDGLQEYSGPESFSDWTDLKHAGKGIRDTTSKILQRISLRGSGLSWQNYRDRYLWAPGSLTFQANLFPIGKPTLQSWPNEFEVLFGYGASDRQAYKDYVAETRFKKLSALWTRSRPQATICFGRAGWDFFRSIFVRQDDLHAVLSDKVHIYQNTRLILTPFFAYGHVSTQEIEQMVEVLKEWKVVMP